MQYFVDNSTLLLKRGKCVCLCVQMKMLCQGQYYLHYHIYFMFKAITVLQFGIKALFWHVHCNDIVKLSN
jgi:hypothetical protein